MNRIKCVSQFFAYLEWAYVKGVQFDMRVRKSGRKIWENEDIVLGAERPNGYYIVDSQLLEEFTEWQENPEVQEWYFTYGGNHTTKNGRSLGNNFTVIKGTWQEARIAMDRERSSKWAFQYGSMEDAGVERFGLEEMNLRAVSLENRDV
ncbi:hypothetical protein PVS_44 [Vibrio phage vB_VspS_VS-ABTNL-3]|nr:hypothetical protein PVS_44 [Vibrio phage vB_VspS_VS-ABTNL-3]